MEHKVLSIHGDYLITIPCANANQCMACAHEKRIAELEASMQAAIDYCRPYLTTRPTKNECFGVSGELLWNMVKLLGKEQ